MIFRHSKNKVANASVDDGDNDDKTRKAKGSKTAQFVLCFVFVGFVFFWIRRDDTVSLTNSGNNSRENEQDSKKDSMMIPDCPSSPWKQDEDLVGTCPGIQVKNATISTAVDCAVACCQDETCVTWQFRQDKGCLQGGDVRIGQEKDGPAAYCSDHPPFRWQGQNLKESPDRNAACSVTTWNPHEREGQCFGLGDPRKGIASAERCMESCCDEGDKCGGWQYHPELGCFYSGGMFSCQKSDDPIVFQPYTGRRKLQSQRSYTGKQGKPAKNWKKGSV